MGQHLERARFLYDVERYAQAEEELQRELAVEPDNATVYAFLGVCLSHRHQHEPAIAAVKQAIALEPDSDYAHFAMARVLNNCSRLHAAEAAIAEAIRLNPLEARYFKLQSSIYYDQSRWHESLAAAQQGLKIDSEHLGCLNIAALALARLGTFQEAESLLLAALTINPEDAFTHSNLGWVYHQQSKYDQAVEHFQEVLRLEPEDEFYRGFIRDRLGDSKGAIEEYDRVLEKNPQDATAYNNRGYARYELSDRLGAIEDYTQAIRLNPRYALAYHNRGCAYHDLGRYEAAIADYTQALKIDPDYTKAYYSRGLVYTLLGANQQWFEVHHYHRAAIDDFTKFLSLAPDHANAVHAYKNRGIAHHRLGQYLAAIDDYDRVLRIHPTDALVRMNHLDATVSATVQQTWNSLTHWVQGIWDQI